MLSLRKASTTALLVLAALGASRALEAASSTFTLITKSNAISVKLPKPDGCKFEFKGAHDSPWIDERGTDHGSSSSTALGSGSKYQVTISGYWINCNSVLKLSNGKGKEANITFSVPATAGKVSFEKATIKEFGNGKLITLAGDNTIEVE